MIMHLTFADGSNPYMTTNQTIPQILKQYKRFAAVNNCTAVFLADNGCRVRQDVVKNWYVYTDDTHAPKRYTYLASALKCAAVGGCKL